MAKKFVYWLLGEKAGCTVVGTWNWLWGIPVEAGGKVAVSVAERIFAVYASSRYKSWPKQWPWQVGAYERAKQKYEEKAQELKTCEQAGRSGPAVGQYRCRPTGHGEGHSN